MMLSLFFKLPLTCTRSVSFSFCTPAEFQPLQQILSRANIPVPDSP
jgi:hypothetical protein